MENSEAAAEGASANHGPGNTADSASLVNSVDSVALARLMEEVRIQEPVLGKHYNRTYNRHNR
jgi:hypothetical protein